MLLGIVLIAIDTVYFCWGAGRR